MEDIIQIKSPHLDQTLFVKKGISESQIDQLIHFANTDPIVQKFTSDARRFKDRESFNQWKKPHTHFYTLTDTDNNLMGLIWFESLPLPEYTPGEEHINVDPQDYTVTFAIRLYEKARGKGLSVQFTQAALLDFRTDDIGIWLATSPDNTPAIRSYENAGFRKIGLRTDGQKMIMILK